MELETSLFIPLKPSFRSRMTTRIKATYALDTPFWRISQSGVWASGCYMFALTALSMPTGLGTMLDIFMMITVGTLGLVCSANLIALLLALIGLRIPCLFTGGVLFNLITFYFMFWIPGSGIIVSIVMSVIITLLGILLGCWTALVTSQHIRTQTKWVMTFLLSIVPFIIIGSYFVEKSDIVGVSPIPYTAISTIPLTSPAELGNFDTQHFTYGSGTDIHREEYGALADLKSSSVDASSYIDKWPWLRTLSWGFDQKSLPLNGRVWMPTGKGPFPLVLMVHGNHLMEDHSDDGYGYLGELLASRGFIAISVDENFLNYSVWSKIPDNDIKVRTWLLLKHLQEIQSFSEQPESPFYEQVDFDNIALIGHSRGGQAAAMAADADRWFLSDSDLNKDLKNFSIKAVIALAPTDAKVDGMQAKLRNVSYMVLQGARDGDLNDYFGERQYGRVSFATNDVGFKTYLHIPNANHSQFNTSWGGLDTSLPKGLFLNRNDLMKGSDQRQVAKVYVSAFLETILHDREEYTSLFRDYRTGLQWLPDSIYFNRFEDGKFIELAAFDENKNSSTIVDELKTEVSGGLNWTEESLTPENTGILLNWNNDDSQESTFSLSWDDEEDGVTDYFTEADGLSFSIADQTVDELDIQTDTLPIAEIEIALETSDGISVTLPLSEFMTIQPMIVPQFTKSMWLEKHFDKGKYDTPSNGIYQTVELPFEVVEKINSSFVPENINKITLKFSEGPGQALLGDLGLYQN
ncbi:alpha/beta hydrolase family protein [Paenibacillus sp. FA6]|uniref:alpha/beta hydrolase family protein n=1 Tax=Paenibacillus sp. FA6 TaxID=3413029 RepID=UPI003F655C42